MPTNLRLGTAWFGTSDYAVPLHHVTSETIDPQRRMSEFRTLTGRRLVQIDQMGARSWSVTVNGLHPQELGMVTEFLDYSSGPFWWVDPVSRATNLLTPQETRFLGGTWTNGTFTTSVFALDGNGQLLSGGTDIAMTGLGQSNSLSTAAMSGAFPVLANTPVTGSAMSVRGAGTASGSTYVQLYWYDRAGALITSNSSYSNLTQTSAFVSCTATPPANAVTAKLVLGPNQTWAFPSVTWTSERREWGEGMGARSVAIMAGQRSPRKAWLTGPSGFTSLSLTVMEVG